MAPDRLFLFIAAILGGTAVAGGAFASHALRQTAFRPYASHL